MPELLWEISNSQVYSSVPLLIAVSLELALEHHKKAKPIKNVLRHVRALLHCYNVHFLSLIFSYVNLSIVNKLHYFGAVKICIVRSVKYFMSYICMKSTKAVRQDQIKSIRALHSDF